MLNKMNKMKDTIPHLMHIKHHKPAPTFYILHMIIYCFNNCRCWQSKSTYSSKICFVRKGKKGDESTLEVTW